MAKRKTKTAKRKPKTKAAQRRSYDTPNLPDGLPALLGEALREGGHHPVSLLTTVAHVVAVEAGDVIDARRRDYTAGKDDSWTFEREQSSRETIAACSRGDYLTQLQRQALEAIERAWPWLQ